MKNNKFIYLIIGILIPIVLYFIFFSGNTCVSYRKITYQDCSKISNPIEYSKCFSNNLKVGDKVCVEWR